MRNFVPSPDLRDHNTVVKEIHNYVSRLCGHLLRYPRFAPPESLSSEPGDAAAGENAQVVAPPPAGETPMDTALKELIRRVQPFGLTKGEVLMIVNLGVGVGVGRPSEGTENADTAENTEGDAGEGGEKGDGQMDVDQSGHADADADADQADGVNGVGVNGDTAEPEGQGQGHGEDAEGEIPEEDYGALALLDTVIEEREERLSNEQVAQILAIIRETLGSGSGNE